MKKLPALALLATLLAGSAGSVFAANGGFEGPCNSRDNHHSGTKRRFQRP